MLLAACARAALRPARCRGLAAAAAAITAPSASAATLLRIDPAEVLAANDDYVAQLKAARKWKAALKRERRVLLGPHASLTFQNYDLIWMQISAMLAIEKGGLAQAQEEVAAYSELLPQGSNLVGVFMVEISHAPTRRAKLIEYCGIEDAIELAWGDTVVRGVPLVGDGVERTTSEGKTSAVHFLSFPFTAADKAAFAALPESEAGSVSVRIGHPKYPHGAALFPGVLQHLQNDLRVSDGE